MHAYIYLHREGEKQMASERQREKVKEGWRDREIIL